MTIKILIAEDEPLMRDRLLLQLSALWPAAQIVLVAENGNDAWEGFVAHQPDIVFLDIRMPGMSGIDLAQKIGTSAHIVFITAYDQYAVAAFEAGAIDYLLKPVQEERLAKCIDRLKEKLQTPTQTPTQEHANMQAILKSLQAALPAEKIKWIKATVGRQIKWRIQPRSATPC